MNAFRSTSVTEEVQEAYPKVTANSEPGEGGVDGRSARLDTASLRLGEALYPSQVRPVDRHLSQAGLASSHLTRLILSTYQNLLAGSSIQRPPTGKFGTHSWSVWR